MNWNITTDEGLQKMDKGLALRGLVTMDQQGFVENQLSPGVSLCRHLATFDVSPFANFVSVVEDVTLADLKLLLENAYSQTTDADAGPGINPSGTGGRFARIAGLLVVYDITAQGMVLSSSGTVLTPGARIRDIAIGGTPYLQGGSWLVDPLALTFDVATLEFLARGGDQYFNADHLSQTYLFTTLGVTDQNALQSYVQTLAGGNPLFDISTVNPEYAIAQSIAGGRITAVPEPCTWVLIGIGSAFVLWRLRRVRH